MEGVKQVEVAFDKLEGGDSAALTKALDRTIADLSALIRMTQTNLNKSDRTRIMCTM
jgi:hypothetical protein